MRKEEPSSYQGGLFCFFFSCIFAFVKSETRKDDEDIVVVATQLGGLLS